MTEHPLDLLEAYGLGLLSSDTDRAIADHLSACADCRQRMRDIERTLGLLAYLAPEQTPPPALESQLLARVAELRHTEARPSLPATPTRIPERPERPPLPAARPPRPSSAVRATALRQRMLLTLGSLAAALLIVASLLGANLHAQQQANATLTSQVRAQQTALAILNAPGSIVRRLHATDPGYINASVTMAMNPQTGQGTLIIAHLPPTPHGHLYELWLVEATGDSAQPQTIPTQSFNVQRDGSAVILFTTRQPLSALRNAGVSVEPQGATPSPTSPMILLLQV